MRRNIALLAVCQALLLTGGVLLASTAALVGARLAPSATLATVPLFAFNLGVMVAVVPASMLMKRIGRRWGFALGGAIGVAGAITSTAGATRSSFELFCAGMAVLGAYMAIGSFYRFAAAEAATPEYRGHAIGWVVGGGLVAAFSGTWLSVVTQHASGFPEFGASYVAVGATAALTIIAALLLDVRTPTAEECARCGRPLFEIARQPDYVIAATVAALGYFVMTLVMNATPLAAHSMAYGFGTTALLIRWHVVAMFAPSFFTGPLIRRLGLTGVLGTGGGLMATSIVVNLVASGQLAMWIALVALGLGWNLLYVGGTTLLTHAYVEEERSKSEGLNEFVVYAMISLASFGAGELQARWGWPAVNASAAVPVMLIAAAVVWLGVRQRSAQR
ncbi:MAG TPA: MFS transporter [Coriobacteriia bacterium]|nr:MFS transporter [Coriobacteriia bacterium]